MRRRFGFDTIYAIHHIACFTARVNASIGWYYVKLHLTINECGEILSFYLMAAKVVKKV